MLNRKSKEVLMALFAYTVSYALGLLLFLILAYYYLDYKFDFNAISEELKKQNESVLRKEDFKPFQRN